MVKQKHETDSFRFTESVAALNSREKERDAAEVAFLDSSPFGLSPERSARSALRDAVVRHTRADEAACVAELLPAATLREGEKGTAARIALDLARALRARRRPGLVETLVQEFSLSSDEGVALMSLAEALLRTPDRETRDLLIRDQVALGDWLSHAGLGHDLTVNAASWGLALTGQIVAPASRPGLIRTVLRRCGAPVVRATIERAMAMMGTHFVLGETIDEALVNAQARQKKGFTHSYDMLGEAALDRKDAEKYRNDYAAAIEAVGKAAQASSAQAPSRGQTVYERPGVSVKLSALHSRYFRAQRARVMTELLPVLRELALRAAHYDIGLTIDAEESGRLDLSLDLFEALCLDPALEGWNGLGFVVQAYGKRAPTVLDWLVDLARRSDRRLMVRLVKGAYWDSEIKRAQVEGQPGFPVFTRKFHTDVSYLACARKLLEARDAVFPQFATHNAQTVAAIYAMAESLGPAYTRDSYEFQGLHGMGDALYDEVGKLNRPCRLYAPVGTHETLLAYLVRRLLENGANSSFLHLLGDPNVSLEKLVEDPAACTRAVAPNAPVGSPHPAIRLPFALFGEARLNSAGMDFEDDSVLRDLERALTCVPEVYHAEPVLAEAPAPGTPLVPFTAQTPTQSPPQPRAPSNAAAGETREIRNPAKRDELVGTVRDATPEEARQAVARATAAFPVWAATPAKARAALLERAARLLEEHRTMFLSLAVREAGKSWPNAVAEVREAVDFLRYYAAQVRDGFDNTTHKPLGALVCISPWNFPLAIFLGQIAAALAAGNTVVAKPSEETPLIAREAVRLMHRAGIPPEALQLLPGAGELGSAIVNDPSIAGVMFTGSTAVARIISRALAGRKGVDGQPVPLVAETGGMNAMVVDSSALPEQVVTDVIISAFDSAGQRCSALRLLCVQEEAAPRLLALLKGAMDELRTGDPASLSTDVGPVIDEEARARIAAHVTRLQAAGAPVHTAPLSPEVARGGTFVAPILIEVTSVAEVGEEVFGPVLHVLRYRRDALEKLIEDLNATGYGLTFGVHSRVPSTIEKLVRRIEAGNIYVNRNIVGAVVGVQPFGGRGLSGTGPKAGGPLAVRRLLAQAPPASFSSGSSKSVSSETISSEAESTQAASSFEASRRVFRLWLEWLAKTDPEAAREAENWGRHGLLGVSLELPSPVGESNVYRLESRGRVVALADTGAGLKRMIGYALSCGNEVAIIAPDEALAGLSELPDGLAGRFYLVEKREDLAGVSVILAEKAEGGATRLQKELLADPTQPLPQLFVADPATLRPEMLLEERVVSTNTAAAGGNAKLMAQI